MPNILLNELTEKINAKLKNNKQLAPFALKTRVYENGIVQIQGIVDVLEEKIQAEELVWRIPGVKKVENNITVCTDGEIDDFDVAFEVGEELHANPVIPETVGIRVNGGEVQLVGSVSNFHEVKEAIETVTKARGVREVHSQLKLNEPPDDATLNNLIQEALMEKLELSPGKYKTTTHHGMVKLDERIPTKQREQIIEVVSRVPGVKDVK